MATGLRFANDDDLLELEPYLDRYWPRTDKAGNLTHSWEVQHKLAMEDIERWLSARKDVPERFDLGRLGLRDQEKLKRAAACLALHYIFAAADMGENDTGLYTRKAAHYINRAREVLESDCQQLDYDLDGSGVIDDDDKNQPFPTRFIRGA